MTTVRHALSLAFSAAAALTGTAASAQQTQPAEAVSLLGDTLRRWAIDDETRNRYEGQLAQARAAFELAPTNADSIVWLGRRLAYLGRVREAIDVYSRGIALHPDNPWLYRHRGHRYITVRELDRAISDLTRASELMRGRADEVEPDGQPNQRNIPIGTLRSNIDYHLALAHYLKGDFAAAIPIYERELVNATNEDRRVSITYWYYLALRRLGRDAEAATLLQRISRSTEVMENDSYRDLLLLYKGELPADSLLKPLADGTMSVADATTAYGVAAWWLAGGRRDEAIQLFRRILAGGQWPAFGYVAAEAELARLATRSP